MASELRAALLFYLHSQAPGHAGNSPPACPPRPGQGPGACAPIGRGGPPRRIQGVAANGRGGPGRALSCWGVCGWEGGRRESHTACVSSPLLSSPLLRVSEGLQLGKGPRPRVS
ncbi:hypothetical protein M758_2G045600 [Ceratodon purpureus]|nr:hypothetical protein M758_2G045600 [Ceratodon purpureus]